MSLIAVGDVGTAWSTQFSPWDTQSLAALDQSLATKPGALGWNELQRWFSQFKKAPHVMNSDFIIHQKIMLWQKLTTRVQVVDATFGHTAWYELWLGLGELRMVSERNISSLGHSWDERWWRTMFLPWDTWKWWKHLTVGHTLDSFFTCLMRPYGILWVAVLYELRIAVGNGRCHGTHHKASISPNW